MSYNKPKHEYKLVTPPQGDHIENRFTDSIGKLSFDEQTKVSPTGQKYVLDLSKSSSFKVDLGGLFPNNTHWIEFKNRGDVHRFDLLILGQDDNGDGGEIKFGNGQAQYRQPDLSRGNMNPRLYWHINNPYHAFNRIRTNQFTTGLLTPLFFTERVVASISLVDSDFNPLTPISGYGFRGNLILRRNGDSSDTVVQNFYETGLNFHMFDFNDNPNFTSDYYTVDLGQLTVMKFENSEWNDVDTNVRYRFFDPEQRYAVFITFRTKKNQSISGYPAVDNPLVNIPSDPTLLDIKLVINE